ncbi:DUF6087 family protein [Streptomyces sp. NPDC056549]|uniref:DUF6087 family protein n=1 Tax=Streptomyces sp. NPDC056549 TaxID=3345864 RepID=UPI003688190F
MDEWAAQRQKCRWPVGGRKAVYLEDGSHRVAHTDPDAPRLIVEGDGHVWQPATKVGYYAAVCRLLNPAPEPPQADALPATRSPRAPGTGRHRRPLTWRDTGA